MTRHVNGHISRHTEPGTTAVPDGEPDPAFSWWPPVVIGELVFFSTLSGRTYALRTTDGELRWRIPLGRYSPGIATDETYYFSLNGRLIATGGRDGPRDGVS